MNPATPAGDDAAGTLAGRCLCGTVALRARPQSLHVDACHCAMCRGWGGGPLMTIACGTTVEIVQGAEAVGRFDSSDWGQRCFCTACGSHLFYLSRQDGAHYVPAGLFGDVAGLALATEIFIDSQPGWYAFSSPTRRLTGAEVMASTGSTG